MREKLMLAIFFALLAGTASAGNLQPVAAYTFDCSGSTTLRIGHCQEGGRPVSLIQGADGNFYGSAQVSMEGSLTSVGGDIFSLTPAGTLTVLHTFLPGSKKSYPNGNLPGMLIQGPDGKLYGTTLFGGVDGCDGYCGYGVLYRMNTDGSGFQIVHKFCSDVTCRGLRLTASSLVAGKDGNLYGTIGAGGTFGYGSIFRIKPSTGAYKIVFNFDFPTDEGATSGVTVASDGTLYAIALGSLPSLLLHYIPATGGLTTAVLNFPVFDGDLPSSPSSGLTLGPNGSLYGLYQIYADNGMGLFEVEPDGSNLQFFPFYTTNVSGGSPDGLLLATDGNFWVADSSGSNSNGDIITISPNDGTLIQTLMPFSQSAAVGDYPMSLTQAADGTLWGTTLQYGASSKGHFADGTIFTLNPGLPAK
jgi:uncharacterized repeat protein (TIGR03803 family)